jgi:PAS domain-containing protein
MDSERQKQLVLILARQFASNLSTPTLIADARGYLVFYNEAAEAVVGRPFAETGEMPLDDWLDVFDPRTTGSEPLPPERRPARIAFDERRPSHLRYLVTSVDGREREIEVTAFPLFAHTDEFVGIVSIFWRS